MSNIEDIQSFIDSAVFMHTVANNPNNLDFQLQNAVSQAIANAAINGLFTTTVNVAAYSANSYALVQLLIKRLIDNGYTASLSTATLTVNW